MARTVARILILLVLIILTRQVLAAGGVVGEAGSCMVKIGFYTAHFTLYQPHSSNNDEYCETLPNTGKTVFVLDYLHDTLNEVPVEFRIIKDLQNLGSFARVENIQQIDDLAAQTVFLAPAAIRADARMTAEFTFTQPGNYLGIITAPHPTKDVTYQAVFPFSVGNTGYGYWPLILVLIAALQVQFMVRLGMPGFLQGWLKRE